MRKKTTVLLSLFACVIFVATYGGVSAKTVGFSQIGSESAWRTAETESIKATAAKHDMTLIFSDAQGKQENQIKALRSFIASKVDGVILAPIVETGWEPVLRELKKAGIPIVLVDRGIKVSDPSLYATLISSDFVFEGQEAAKWLVRKTGGKANIAELQGIPGAAPTIGRKNGFEEILKKYPNMKIIKSQTGNFNRADGKQVMEAFLKADDGNINAVFAHNDAMALGAIQAIEAAGMKPGENIFVVSIDGMREAFDAMIAGKLNCTVECNPLLGPLVIPAIEKAMSGEKLTKWIRQNDGVFSKETASTSIGSRKY
jgi:simple sugar transport system substrate-binding protein